MGVAPRLSGEIRPCNQSQHNIKATTSKMLSLGNFLVSRKLLSIRTCMSCPAMLIGSVRCRLSSNLGFAKVLCPRCLHLFR